MVILEVFGLPRRLGIDVAQLQRRSYELSRRSIRTSTRPRRLSGRPRILEVSARLNAAYRVLRDSSSSGGAFGFTVAAFFVVTPSRAVPGIPRAAIGSRSTRYAALSRAETSRISACRSGGAAWWKSGWAAPRQLVERPLELGDVDAQPPRQPDTSK